MAKKKDNVKPIWNGPEGSIIGQYQMPDEKELRSAGYMTVHEFVTKLERGMREYMTNNWGLSIEEDDLHHPEDLASAANTYTESVMFCIQTFGAGNTNDE